MKSSSGVVDAYRVCFGAGGLNEYGAAYRVGVDVGNVSAGTWTAKKATITDAEGNGTKGQATFSYKKPGVYNVTLTLANAHGS